MNIKTEKPNIMDDKYRMVVDGKSKCNLDLYDSDIFEWKVNNGERLSVEETGRWNDIKEKKKNGGYTDFEMDDMRDKASRYLQYKREEAFIDFLVNIAHIVAPAIIYETAVTAYRGIKKIRK